ncbi:MAG TPA: FxsA family protein [Bacillota bacterium]|nr:FxsA family protein [Bacillota bacterium]
MRLRWLLLAFLIVPALEIGLLVWAGGKIGPWWVVALIILTGMAGVTIAKQQGVATWYQAKRDMYAGKVPTIHILNGICIFIGGVFLFTPGFITDIVGFILVLPWTRRFLIKYIQRLIKKMIDKHTIVFRKW